MDLTTIVRGIAHFIMFGILLWVSWGVMAWLAVIAFTKEHPCMFGSAAFSRPPRLTVPPTPKIEPCCHDNDIVKIARVALMADARKRFDEMVLGVVKDA